MNPLVMAKRYVGIRTDEILLFAHIIIFYSILLHLVSAHDLTICIKLESAEHITDRYKQIAYIRRLRASDW